jgi:hypothetical protein
LLNGEPNSNLKSAGVCVQVYRLEKDAKPAAKAVKAVATATISGPAREKIAKEAKETGAKGGYVPTQKGQKKGMEWNCFH